MYLFNIIIFTILVVPYSFNYIKKYRLTPASFFIVMEISYFYGICFAPKGKQDYAIKLETIYVFALLFFIIGIESCKIVGTWRKNSIITRGYLYTEGSFSDGELSRQQKITIWIIILVSILACSYLFVVGGVNVFIRSLIDFFTDVNTTYKRERAAFFSVRGVGYIYQFRAILLPILTVYIAFCDKHRLPKFLSYPLVTLMIVFLLGTGQRNAFVFFCMVVFMYSWVMASEYRIKTFSSGQIIVLGAAAILFLITLTISNGRVSDESNQVAGAFQSLIDRAFGVNQRTAILAFSYIDTQPTSWGYDWFMTLRDLLPGKSGYLTVSRITYYLAYGTYKGTGDPCIWGSAWYNFNWLGITVFPFILGYFYHHVYRNMIRMPNKNRLYMLIYCGLAVYLGLWNYGTPMNLFNIGVVALLLLRWIMFTVLRQKGNDSNRTEMHELYIHS